MFTTILLLLIVIVLVASSVRIVQEYERGVIFRLGRFVGVRGPGLFLLIPFIERMQKVDLRVVTMDVPAQEAITRDNVTVKVNAVVYFRVVNPGDAVIKVLDHIKATSQLSQTTLRSVLGQSELDELLAHREQLNQRLQRIIDEGTEPWGVKVSLVEIRDVELPQSMQRAMAAQAEAERERRAKIIHADGEYQAAEKLAEAARIIAAEPAALQLRYLQTLREMATDKANTIIFPLPLDLVTPFVEMVGRRRPGSGASE
ncbi:MAG: slipin family protein [Firmicutes bacterium]|nr:slipin family protein [Bacillota bacterium]